MVLSSKVAFLTCLAFVSGMCWLVRQVARPVVELPVPVVVRAPQAPTAALASTGQIGDRNVAAPAGAAHRRFERPSPAVAGVVETPRPAAVVALSPEATAPAADRGADFLPPPVVDAAAEVALAAEDSEDGLAPAVARAPRALAEPTRGDVPISEVDTPLPADAGGIPVAVVTDEPPRPARLLAAIAPAAHPQAPAPGATATHYTVRRGDTLVRIMRRHWKTDDPAMLRVLVAANPRIATRRDRIFPGDVLTIPPLADARRQAAALAAAAPGSAARGRLASADRKQPPAVAGSANHRGRAAVRWYTVRRRDSLASIARRMLKDERRWREIALLNGLRNANKLRPGERIKLPARPSDT